MAEIGAPISLDGWQSIRIVGASACVIFILHQKIQKMAKCTFWYQLTQVDPDKTQRAVKWLCACKHKNVKYFLSHVRPYGGADLRLCSPQPDARHQLMLQDHRHRVNASCCVLVYAPAFTSTKLYCLITEVHRCEQLAQGCYLTTWWPGLELAITESLV